MSRLARISIVTLSVIVFLYVGLGYVLDKSNDDKSYRSLGVFGEVLQHIQEDYVDEPNMTVVTNGAMRTDFWNPRPAFRVLEPARVCRLSRSHEELATRGSRNDNLEAIRLHRRRFRCA